MQNCYIGDVGDFLKYGLLNFILEKHSSLTLGVNWYKNSEQATSVNVRAFSYLNETDRFHSRLKLCNPGLFKKMQEIDRSVDEIKKHHVLPRKTLYYDKAITKNRSDWHKGALQRLAQADLVFLDPDNGIQTNSIKDNQRNAFKYAFRQEIIDYYERGQLVIVYNHKSRQKEEVYQERFGKLRNLAGKAAGIYILRAHRYTCRDFVFLVQQKNKNLIEELITNFTRSTWGEKKHFERVGLPILA